MSTGIEWTDETWNPIAGCSIISPGCKNCYAMYQAHRLANNPKTPHYAGTTEVVNNKIVWTGRIGVAPDRTLFAPYRRKRPTTYFVNSMSDLFHEDVSIGATARIFALMARCDQHDFQILTKRGEIMRDMLQWDAFWNAVEAECERQSYKLHDRIVLLAERQRAGVAQGLLPNVRLGVSVERQREADIRIPQLQATPAAFRFLSIEPMLEALRPDLAAIDWVICGGESGRNHARIFDLAWSRKLRDRCRAAGIPFYLKQIGSNPISSDECDNARVFASRRFPARHYRGGDPAEWPDDLKVRELPAAT